MNNNTTFSNIFKTIRTVCHFLPLLISLAWLIYWIFNPANWVADYILAPMMMIGWISLIIARPLKTVITGFKFIKAGLKIGYDITMIIPACYTTALIGFFIALTAFMLILMYFPAGITLYFLFSEGNAVSENTYI